MARKILIIDDDDDILEILSLIFRNQDYEIMVSNKGMNPGQIKEVKPDLIILDVNIRGSEIMGDEICMALKSQYETQNLPVLLLSGEENLSSIANECHADGFICKPFDINKLELKVGSYLGVDLQ